jgi:UDP-N-acetylmuramyl pentapeptide phosphotransferase/UDP-N-acetylglucosamine-1-phosphate transferase
MIESLFFCSLLVIGFLSLIIINYFCKKIRLIDSGVGIQKNISFKGTPLSGGIYFLISYLIFIYNFDFLNNYLAITITLLFILGVVSDLDILKKPQSKFYLQLFSVMLFLFFSENFLVQKTSVLLLDYFIDNRYFSILFTSFCILICINGNNFIDGTNANALLNSLLINITFYFVIENYSSREFETLYIVLFIILHFPFIITNLLNLNFLGDSGSYIIGFINSINVIYITQYFDLSPVFAIGIIFYISFENLFSFVRKKIEKKSPLYPDNLHLHMLIKNKFIKKKFSVRNASNLTSIVINMHNMPFFYLYFLNRNTGYVLFLIVLIQCLSYMFFYLKIKSDVIK